jgi:hypothetical protein
MRDGCAKKQPNFITREVIRMLKGILKKALCASKQNKTQTRLPESSIEGKETSIASFDPLLQCVLQKFERFDVKHSTVIVYRAKIDSSKNKAYRLDGIYYYLMVINGYAIIADYQGRDITVYKLHADEENILVCIDQGYSCENEISGAERIAEKSFGIVDKSELWLEFLENMKNSGYLTKSVVESITVIWNRHMILSENAN